MAYTNIAWTIYGYLEALMLNDESINDVRSVHVLNTPETMKDSYAKQNRGIEIRLNSSSGGVETVNYVERIYEFTLRLFLNDPEDTQKIIMDFSEEILEVLRDNYNLATGYIVKTTMNVDIPEQEKSPIKYCDLTIEVIYDG